VTGGGIFGDLLDQAQEGKVDVGVLVED